VNGQQHFEQAEQDIARANGAELGGWAEYLIARAQVHATLALASAVATGAGLATDGGEAS
jgi:hypothetical protein